jgi:hypothetical protein
MASDKTRPDEDDSDPADPATDVPGAASREAAESPDADAAPKKAVTASDAAAAGGPKPKKKKKKPAAAASAPVPAAPAVTAPPRPVPPRQGTALGKSLVLFLIVVGGLAAGFALLGHDTGRSDGPAQVKWNTGQVVDVEITLVASDDKDLACASEEVIEGRHCQFEAKAKPWSKGTDPGTQLLKPYTTTDRIQFLAAGLWDQPAMAKDKLPPSRFTVKCKLKVEGKAKKPSIRWAADQQWNDQTNDWFAGSVSDCSVQKL